MLVIARDLSAFLSTLIYNFWVFGGGFDVIGFYVVFTDHSVSGSGRFVCCGTRNVAGMIDGLQ